MIHLWLWLFAALAGLVVVSTVGAVLRRPQRVGGVPRPACGAGSPQRGVIRRYGDPNFPAGTASRSPRRRARHRGRVVRRPFDRCDRSAESPACARPGPALAGPRRPSWEPG